MDNIILIGFMGTGKTVVGKLLAQKLKMDYMDTDELIESNSGKTINEIFKNEGEDSFRKLETGVVNGLFNLSGSVISTGGGIVLRPENVKKLKNIGPLVLLWADAKTIYKRLKKDKTRPLIQGDDPQAKINEILDQRKPVYDESADHTIDTSRLSPEQACNKIAELLERNK